MRLIDADMLRINAEEFIYSDEMRKIFIDEQSKEKQMELDFFIEGKIKTLINYQPTVDAVKVIRCKDCKYYFKPKLKECKGSYCKKYLIGSYRLNDDMEKADNWFCADGERKTE